MAETVDSLTDRHRDLTDELASRLRSRGDIHAVVIRTYAETWQNTTGLSVTERRETCKVATVDLDVEAARADGEIAALRAELTHIELAVKYADA